MIHPMVRPDAELRDQVMGELRLNTRIDLANISVSVSEGIVNLFGSVGSYYEHLAAQEAAHRVAGTRGVANQIHVRKPNYPIRPDDDIARACRSTRDRRLLVPEQAIETTVASGWVTVGGNVSSWRQCHNLESAIRNLPGVKGVLNHVHIVESPVDEE